MDTKGPQTGGMKGWMTHLIAVAIFLLVPVIYFSPILGGKVLVQNDILTWKAMSKEIQDHREQYNEDPLWTNSMFGGMPAYQISMKDRGNLLDHLGTIMGLGLPKPMNFLFIAMLGTYLLLISMKVDWRLAIGGALAYGLGTYFITFIEAGHTSKAHAVAYMPMVMAGLSYLFRRNLWMGLALSAIGIGMQFTVNHLQISYYLFMALGIWIISELIYAAREGQLAAFVREKLILGLVLALALGANYTRLATTLEYSPVTIRGASELTPPEGAEPAGSGLDYNYAMSWSYGVGESLTLMFPSFAGKSSAHSFLQEGHEDSETYQFFGRLAARGQEGQQKAQQLQQLSVSYWGALPTTSGPIYIGAVVCFLFILGCFIVPARQRWWLIAVALLGMILGWGSNFAAINKLLFNYLPLYNKFRTPMMAFVLTDLAVVILAILGLQQLFNKELAEKFRLRQLYTATGISVVLGLIVMAGSSMFDLTGARLSAILAENSDPDLFGLAEALKKDRAGIMQADAFRSLGFILAAAALLWAFVSGKLKNMAVVGLGVVALIVADLMTVNLQYLDSGDFQDGDYYENVFNRGIPAINDKDPHFRVFNATRPMDQDGLTPYRYHAMGGYHGAKLRRWQDLVDRYMSRQMTPNFINMMNTKYVIGQGNRVQQNPGALGNAWFVDSITYVENPDEEIAAVGTFQPARQLIVNRNDEYFDADYLGGFTEGNITRATDSVTSYKAASGSIRLTSYKANELKYEYDIPRDQLAVFSEVYYNGNKDWVSTVDGAPASHFRGNFIQRAMVLPAGKHEVVFSFEPKTHSRSKPISLISSGILWLVILFSLFRAFTGARRRDTSTTSETADSAA